MIHPSFKMSAHVVGIVCCAMLLFTGNALGQGKAAQKTKTIVGDLLEIDRDLYIVRGERGEIQIEATYKTEVTEEFEFGDRIKALVLMNNGFCLLGCLSLSQGISLIGNLDWGR